MPLISEHDPGIVPRLRSLPGRLIMLPSVTGRVIKLCPIDTHVSTNGKDKRTPPALGPTFVSCSDPYGTSRVVP